MVEKTYISYNNVHKLCQEAAEKIKEFKPNLMVAIGKTDDEERGQRLLTHLF
jgi:hypoxanthine phosphoribosyltransferase